MIYIALCTFMFLIYGERRCNPDSIVNQCLAAAPSDFACCWQRGMCSCSPTCCDPTPAGSPSGDLGSINKVYDNLQNLATLNRTAPAFPSDLPVAGNKGGSFLTMMSQVGGGAGGSSRLEPALAA